uniref:HotDog ACOT-type domain-containing protein n=1 Tax=Rhodosorus marinus TaxID=101924 RepID=A0A7S3EKG5_9RHOD|mmetsp:Transcript_39842/g.158445  ORF Transcript_39842/g.158445 Transcript_39842/m.158445 type:complete len:221 (+) Transcript_39842:3954-4616(+)
MESAKRRKELSVRWMEAQKAAAREGVMPSASTLAASEKGLSRREYLTVRETEVVVRKQMLPRHNNHLNIIFGGDVLRWMLGVAQVTAKRFTGNTHMIVISMNRIDFRETIKPEHVVEMHARVVSVQNTTIEVEIEAFVDKTMDGRGIVTSHSGYFTVLNVDEIGFRRAIQVGLKHTDDDQDALRRCAKAIARRDFDERIEVSGDVKSDKFFLDGLPVQGS